MKGKLIVVEGACDGIGKSTQFSMLKDKLVSDGYEVVTHHFPTYDKLEGKLVESYLKGEFGKPSELSPYFVNSLYAIDRAIVWKNELQKEYEAGKIVLLDRYTTSSLIYQSSLIDDINLKNEFIDYVIDYEYNRLGIGRPDEVIFLNAPFDLVTKLRSERKENDGVVNDIHERNLEFMKRVYESSLYVANKLNWLDISCTDDEQFKTREEISDNIYKLIKK